MYFYEMYIDIAHCVQILQSTRQKRSDSFNFLEENIIF